MINEPSQVDIRFAYTPGNTIQVLVKCKFAIHTIRYVKNGVANALDHEGFLQMCYVK